jgi:alkylated DNA repair dioxygenase AlkB
MKTLFPLELPRQDVPRIPGLSYFADYITPAEERNLVAAIDAQPWDTSWDRRRQPYGVSYGKEAGSRADIPPWGLELARRMHAQGLTERQFDQMLINEYLPGQGIAWHRDYDPFDRTVVSSRGAARVAVT